MPKSTNKITRWCKSSVHTEYIAKLKKKDCTQLFLPGILSRSVADMPYIRKYLSLNGHGLKHALLTENAKIILNASSHKKAKDNQKLIFVHQFDFYRLSSYFSAFETFKENKLVVPSIEFIALSKYDKTFPSIEFDSDELKSKYPELTANMLGAIPPEVWIGVAVWPRVEKDLNQWWEFPQDKKVVISMAVYAISSLAGTSWPIKIASKKAPDIMELLDFDKADSVADSSVAFEPLKTKTSSTEIEETEDKSNKKEIANVFPDEIEESLVTFKECVKSLSLATFDKDQARYLTEFAKHIQHLTDISANSDIFQEAVSEILNFLIELAIIGDLAWFEDQNFKAMFENCWRFYLANNADELFFEWKIKEVLENILVNLAIAESNYKLTEEQLAQNKDTIASFDVLENAGFIEKRKQQLQIANLEEKNANIKKQLETSKDVLHESILPSGITLDCLEQNILDPDSYPCMDHSVLNKLKELIKEIKDNLTVEKTISEASAPNQEGQIPAENADSSRTESAEDAVTEENAVTEIEVAQETTSDTEPETLAESTKEIVYTEVTDIATESPISAMHPDSLVPPEVVEEPSSIEISANTIIDIDEVIDTNGFEHDPAVLINRLESSLKRYGSISSIDVNSLALHCVSNNFLNFGHFAILSSKELCDKPDELFSQDLFKCAYFGMNVWNNNSRSFEHSQIMLNTLDQKKLDEWLSKKPGGKFSAFLLFTACFQTALFAGNSTLAPSILNQIKHCFDSTTSDLVTDLVHFCNRGGMLTLKELQRFEGITEPPTQKYLVRLSDWKEIITHSTRGWAPVRMALNACLKDGPFTEVVRAINDNNRFASKTVKQFVNDYSHQEKIRTLMIKSVAEYSQDKIEANARDSFIRTVEELRDIASHWLADQERAKVLQDNIEVFTHRIGARLKNVQEAFQKTRATSPYFEVTTAVSVAETCVSNILTAIGGKEDSVWNEERADLWFITPKTLLSASAPATEPTYQMTWLLDIIKNGFDLSEMYQEAYDNKIFHIAHLILMHLTEQGEDKSVELAEVTQKVATKLRDYKKKKEHLELALDNANISFLIDDARHAQLSSELEYLNDKILNHSPLTDLQTISDPLDLLDKELNERYAPRLKELSVEYRSVLQKAQTTLGEGAVPPFWQNQMEEALKNKDIPVAEEMIDALTNAINTGTKIQEDRFEHNEVFANFLKAEKQIFNFLLTAKDPGVLINATLQESSHGLDFSRKPQGLRNAIKSIVSLRTARPPRDINQNYFSEIVEILSFLGIKSVDTYSAVVSSKLKFELRGGLVHILMPLKDNNAGHPYTDFGQNQYKELDMLISHKEWDQAHLENLFETELIGKKRFLLISSHPLNLEQRNKFASYCKSKQKTIFLVDLAIIYYLGSILHDKSSSEAIRNFLQTVIPFTFYNSYVGEKQTPPPPEMRYGRSSEIGQLLDMNQGAAIAYGGRQLGKSTILSQVQRQFEDRANKKFAFYHQGDAYFGGHIEASSAEQRESRIWSIIYKDFCDTGFLKKQVNPTTPDMRASITDCLAKQTDLRVMIIFDEIDPLLERDHSNNFSIFRGLRELVSAQTSEHRFKLIIGGLQNVKRFEDSPNYPLNQLGRSLNISIMSVSDALKLIKEPLQAYGFRFENSLVPSRILSVTNRHPSLIQIFCSELVKHLASNFHGDVANQIITDSDVTRVFDKDDVRALIRQRFEMTLNLDTRYEIIIYSLSLNGRGNQSFSAAQVKEISSCWLPELKTKTDSQVEAILEELVGLGVLRSIKRQGFAFRNSNILGLLGNNRDIESKLLQAMNKAETDDPLDRHAFVESVGMPSPLTFRDEKQILGMADPDQNEIGPKTTRHYTVSIITGSAALGINQLEQTLPYIDDFSLPWTAKTNKYSLLSFKESDFSNLKYFDKRLRSYIALAEKEPQIVLIEIAGSYPAENVLSMIDVAYQAKDAYKKGFYPCKVLFLFTPKALWNWLSTGKNILLQERALAHINLALWKHVGMRSLLPQIELPDADDVYQTLQEYTHGWYISIYRLCKLKKENDVNTIKKLGSKFKKISELTIKESQVFLAAAGISDVEWAAPLLKKLIEVQGDSKFNADDLKLIILEYDIKGIPVELVEMAMEWLSRLNLIKLVQSLDAADISACYQVEPAVKSCLVKGHE